MKSRKSFIAKKEKYQIFHDEDLAQFGDLYFPEDEIDSDEYLIDKDIAELMNDNLKSE